MAGETHTYGEWIGRRVVDRRHQGMGQITGIFYDDRTGRPEWLTVSLGSSAAQRLVPVAGAGARDRDLAVDFDLEVVEGAPEVDVADGHLEEAAERRLYRHYGLDPDAADPEIMDGGLDRVDSDRQAAPGDESSQGTAADRPARTGSAGTGGAETGTGRPLP